MNVIIKTPLITWRTGKTTISATLLIFTKTEAERSVLLFPRKNSYSWESRFLSASSDRSLQIVAFNFNCFAFKKILIIDENQLDSIKALIRIKILYLGSKSNKLFKKLIEVFGLPIMKLNSLAKKNITINSEIPAKIEIGKR